MTLSMKGVLGAAMLLVPAMATAQDAADGPELGLGVIAHGVVRPGLNDRMPDGTRYLAPEEKTVDIQALYRSRPLDFALKPRLTAKVQINTSGLTSFASVGAEWRQHAFRQRVYGQIGIGLTVHDGYSSIPDPFDLTPGSADFWKRYDLYARRINFGSRVLFNPNASIGARIDRDWAVEATWDHFSHAGLFGRENDGIDTFGARLIRTIGRRGR